MDDGLVFGDGQKLIGLIADEETCSGFLLAGIGVCIDDRNNFLAVDEVTTDDAIAAFYQDLYNRRDVAIIIINSNVAQRIQGILSERPKVLPIVIEIPNKYEIAKIPLD